MGRRGIIQYNTYFCSAVNGFYFKHDGRKGYYVTIDMYPCPAVHVSLEHDGTKRYDTNDTYYCPSVDSFFKHDGKKGYDTINMYLCRAVGGFF